MDRLLPLERSVGLFPSGTGIWSRNMRLSLKLQSGVWSGAPSPRNMIDPTAWLGVGIRLSTTLIAMGKGGRKLVRNVFPATRYH